MFVFSLIGWCMVIAFLPMEVLSRHAQPIGAGRVAKENPTILVEDIDGCGATVQEPG
jgi:hypothetical protein